MEKNNKKMNLNKQNNNLINLLFKYYLQMIVIQQLKVILNNKKMNKTILIKIKNNKLKMMNKVGLQQIIYIYQMRIY